MKHSHPSVPEERRARDDHPACEHCADDRGAHAATEAKPTAASKYYCPMCPGVEADKPGDCSKCGMPLERNPAYREAAKTIWTCPMHPQIRQDHPGACPICGMDLEPVGGATADEEEQREIRRLRTKLWISAALTFPLLVLAMSGMLGFQTEVWFSNRVRGWIELALATPVVLWAGAMFFARGWRSIVTWQLNMFTLIALGVGAAFWFSVVAVVAPGFFRCRFDSMAKSDSILRPPPSSPRSCCLGNSSKRVRAAAPARQ